MAPSDVHSASGNNAARTHDDLDLPPLTEPALPLPADLPHYSDIVRSSRPPPSFESQFGSEFYGPDTQLQRPRSSPLPFTPRSNLAIESLSPTIEASRHQHHDSTNQYHETHSHTHNTHSRHNDPPPPTYRQAARWGRYKTEREYLDALRTWAESKQYVDINSPEFPSGLMGYYGHHTMEERRAQMETERAARKRAKEERKAAMARMKQQHAEVQAQLDARAAAAGSSSNENSGGNVSSGSGGGNGGFMRWRRSSPTQAHFSLRRQASRQLIGDEAGTGTAGIAGSGVENADDGGVAEQRTEECAGPSEVQGGAEETTPTKKKGFAAGMRSIRRRMSLM